MAPTAAYDQIADWYEDEFLAASAGRDPIGVKAALSDLLGLGGGLCLEVGCGTGTHAGQVRDLGWTPLGWTSRQRCCAVPPAGCRSPGRMPAGCRSGTRRSLR